MSSFLKLRKMWTAKFFAVTLVTTVFIRDAESWKPRRRGGSLLPCSPRVCQVSSWSAWSPCTHLCGTTGTQTRARTVAVTATCGGSCPHLSEIRSCNRDNCQNSGTPSRNGCSCPPGYVGTCCEIGKLKKKKSASKTHTKSLHTCTQVSVLRCLQGEVQMYCCWLVSMPRFTAEFQL